ncbi:MAG: UDP-N-acetylmuramate--L-alanine ligase [Nitrospirae bacterium RBG_19FT_COMBO_42_15]|nr:MAG: UDP-N-acetylmuramate--L-alanine ligase [Nitrospirae bacterium RBG_19FT_COMBO_42_15]
MFKKIKHIHFVGIGGIGMSGIAEVLLNLGYKVSGSDMNLSDTTKHLKDIGAIIYKGHAASNIAGADVVVISSAVSQENEEVKAAKKLLIPVIPRAEMLAELMRLKYGIAVAGAHGKTTTTSIIATVLARGNIDPTVVIGGKLNSFGTNAKLGQGDFLLAEADESDGSFLKLSPTIAVVTTIDEEHLDYYKNLDAIKKAFLSFVNKVPFYGIAILCLDDKNIQDIIPSVEKRYVTYGFSAQADFAGKDIELKGFESSFKVINRGKDLGRFILKMPGLHNVYNALAAVAVGLELEIDIDAIKKAFAEFSGVQRRFQVKGEINGVMVVDDYGHHPAEIKATLAAAKSGWDKRTIVIFQPHRYTRTKDLMKDFATAFYQADVLILTDIYAAGETPIEGVTGERLYETIKGHGHKEVMFIKNKNEIPDYVLKMLKKDDIVITLGAGDVWKIGGEIVERIQGQKR